MFDWDAIIVGGGPAGLTAGIYLCQAKYRTLLIDKEAGGGYIQNIDLIENYPGYKEGVNGAKLAAEMILQAKKYGLTVENLEVTGIEVFSGTRYVNCAGGRGFTTNVIILAGGARNKKIGVPGEEELAGKGVFECALCDGGEYQGKTVTVCGGGNSGLTEALYLSKIAAKVIVVEFMPKLTATVLLQDRVAASKNMTVYAGTKVEAIEGNDRVEGITVSKDGKRETLKTDGVLVHIGLIPNTSYLEGIIPLDKQGSIVVNEKMQTEEPHIFAAGDIRSGSSRQVATSVGDGALAAINAIHLMQEEG